jgi:plasmid stability protein
MPPCVDDKKSKFEFKKALIVRKKRHYRTLEDEVSAKSI